MDRGKRPHVSQPRGFGRKIRAWIQSRRLRAMARSPSGKVGLGLTKRVMVGPHGILSVSKAVKRRNFTQVPHLGGDR